MGTYLTTTILLNFLLFFLLSTRKIAQCAESPLKNSFESNATNGPNSPNNATEAPLRYVRGVYEIPEAPNSIPVIYDSYFPIVFEFNLPTWDVQSMKIQFWKDHNNCTESDNFTDGYPCPVMFHSNKWIEYFVGNMTLWKNLWLDDPLEGHSPDENNADLDLPLLFSRNHSLILDQEYYCSKIVNHFTNFQTTREKVTQYLRLLNKCENEVVHIKKNLNGTATFLESLYHQTFSSFVTDYWDRLPDMISKQAATVNLYTSLESTLLLHQFMETQKWTLALGSCQQSQIPWSLIDHDEIFNAIRSHVHVFEHQLAIPLSEMSKYYKLPLTDCVFIERDSLLVRVLIPIRSHAKEESQHRVEKDDGQELAKNPYKIIKFEPIIFHKDGEFCWIDGIRERRFISDSTHPGNLYVTECSDQQEQKLCRIPGNHFSSHDAADPCAQALYLDSEPAILESCSLKCAPIQGRPTAYKYFNLAHTFDDNFIYSVADEDSRIEIVCKNEQMGIGKLSWASWNLTVPCGCDVTGGSGGARPSINFEIAPPCQNQLIVERIRPYHWRNVEKRDKSPLSEASSESANFSIKSQHEFVALLDQRYGSYTTLHYVTLWFIIALLVVGVGVLGYFVVQLQRWKSHEQFKESRLIYSNVMDSREDFAMERQQQQQQNPNSRY